MAPRKIASFAVMAAFMAMNAATSKPKAGSDEDVTASAPAAVDAASPSETLAPPTNASDVARFPTDEEPLGNVTAKIKSPTKVLKTGSAKGETFASLAVGDSVTTIAGHNGFVLVEFPDPKKPGTFLIGWIPGAAFQETPPPKKPPPPPKCVGDDFVTVSFKPPTQICRRMCSEDSDCGEGGSCETAQLLNLDGSRAGFVDVCARGSRAQPGAPKPVAKDKGCDIGIDTTCEFNESCQIQPDGSGKCVVQCPAGQARGDKGCGRRCATSRECGAGQACTLVMPKGTICQ